METERLFLKRYTLEDFAIFASLWADPEVVRYIGNGRARSKEEAYKSFHEWLLPGYREGRGLFLIVDKESGERLGHAGIVQQMIDGKREFEIGYWLLPKFWGQGYASEAASFFKNYAVNELGYERLICLIHEKNERSIHIASKLDMRFEKMASFNAIKVCVYSWKKTKEQIHNTFV